MKGDWIRGRLLLAVCSSYPPFFHHQSPSPHSSAMPTTRTVLGDITPTPGHRSLCLLISGLILPTRSSPPTLSHGIPEAVLWGLLLMPGHSSTTITSLSSRMIVISHIPPLMTYTGCLTLIIQGMICSRTSIWTTCGCVAF